MQVTSLLAGTGLLYKANLIVKAADAVWEDVQPLLAAAKQQQLCPAGMFSRADIDWAIGICLSRTVRLIDRSDEIVLCPFADLFNHSSDSKAFLVWDSKQQAVGLTSDRAYKPGEQVGRGQAIMGRGAQHGWLLSCLTFAAAGDKGSGRCCARVCSSVCSRVGQHVVLRCEVMAWNAPLASAHLFM